MNTIEAPPVQFAVVREDPRIEELVIREQGSRNALLIASGGCTALHLRAVLPDLQIELIDPNLAQLALVDRKLEALRGLDVEAAHASPFNIGRGNADGLHECGNFERLFRLLRDALDSFVVDAEERLRRFQSDSDWQDVTQHKYWPAAFASAFTDDLLIAMFGPDAVQHAVRGSYPSYFRQQLERGLQADDRAANPWLHHVLLGHYLEQPMAWPPYLREHHTDFGAFPTHQCPLLEMGSFATFDFAQISNVMDWMDEPSCRALAQRLCKELRPGAVVLWRQLNNSRDLTEYFAPHFAFSPERDAALTKGERSLFYNQVRCGIRQ